MNRKKTSFSLLQILTVILMLGLLAFSLASPPKAQAQVTPTTYGSFTNNTPVANGSAVTVNASIDVPQNKGLALLPTFAGTNAGTANVTFAFQVSADGTNYTTTTPLTATFALNGTTAVRGYTNFAPSVLNNVRKIRLSTISNAHTATVFVTNVIWSVSN